MMDPLNRFRERINSRLPTGLKVGTSLVTIYPHTTRVEFVDDLADTPGVRTWTAIGRAIFRIVMAISVALIGFAAVTALLGSTEATAANDPANMVAIPGVNDFIPWSAAGYALGALFLSAFLHELAHGVAARLEGVPVEEMGLGFILAIPVAAYVRVDEDALEAAAPAARRRILAAGVMANLSLTAIAGAVFLLPGLDLAAAFWTYFGLVRGGTAATAADVGALGFVANSAFWLLFINANLVVLNALPALPMDGGRFLRADIESVTDRGTPGPTTVTWTLTGLTVVAFAMALFGPQMGVSL